MMLIHAGKICSVVDSVIRTESSVSYYARVDIRSEVVLDRPNLGYGKFKTAMVVAL